jgi:hypothetical protein
MLAAAAGAQPVGPVHPGPYVFASGGIDPTFTVGGGAGTSLEVLGRRVAAEVGAALPLPFHGLPGTFRLFGAGRGVLLPLGDGSHGLSHRTILRLDRVQNDAFSGLGTSVEGHLELGRLEPHFFYAVTAGATVRLASLIQFSALVARNYEGSGVAPPRDGWYAFPGVSWHAAIHTGGELTPAWIGYIRFHLTRESGLRSSAELLGPGVFTFGLAFGATWHPARSAAPRSG